MRKSFADTMLEVGQKDPKLVVLIGDISHFILQPFAKACPGRFYNVGICEPTIVSMGAGLSHAGLYPVIHTIAPFIVERSFEQIKLDFCYHGLGGNLISVGSAFDYSGLGCSHHCYDDLALVKTLPGTEVIYPATQKEFNILFKQTYDDGKLTYFRLPATKHNIEIKESDIEFGRAVKIKEGKDYTIIVTGPQLQTVMDSMEELEKIGMDIEVLYVHTLKPFDEKSILQSVNKTKKFLVIEEHSKFGGLGDEVIRSVHGSGLYKSDFINIPDNFIRNYGHYNEHRNALGMSKENIIKIIKNNL